jgi:sRNA-binding regulator protein Hfq
MALRKNKQQLQIHFKNGWKHEFILQSMEL